MPNHFEIKNLLLFSQPNTLFPHTVCIAVLHIKLKVFLKEHSDFNASLFLRDFSCTIHDSIRDEFVWSPNGKQPYNGTLKSYVAKISLNKF